MYDIPDAETAFKGEEETENNLSVKKNKNVISAVGVIRSHEILLGLKLLSRSFRVLNSCCNDFKSTFVFMIILYHESFSVVSEVVDVKTMLKFE